MIRGLQSQSINRFRHRFIFTPWQSFWLRLNLLVNSIYLLSDVTMIECMRIL